MIAGDGGGKAVYRPETAPGRLEAGPASGGAAAASGGGAADNFKVCVRVRPANKKERGNGQPIVEVVDESVIVFDPKADNAPVLGPAARKRRNPTVLEKRARDVQFAFDRVFSEHASQEAVFEETTRPLLDGVLDGYNATVFAYGATGAGKTHTMLGTDDSPGVMLLTMKDLFSRLDHINDHTKCDVAVSYLEVYNETVKDLLASHSRCLAVREDANQGVCVSGLSLHKPTNVLELLGLLREGNERRTQHPTDANAQSSRSHAVFQVHVHQQSRQAGLRAEVKVAKMSLIDLAGSERATVTNNRGMRMREGANINKSLLALGNCINALAAPGSKKAGHIPYRNSKLTRILKDSLGGNCRTVMIAAISPSSTSSEDTYNTLKYANRAKDIKVSIKRNTVDVDFHISKYKQITQELRDQVAQLHAKLQVYEAQGPPPPAVGAGGIPAPAPVSALVVEQQEAMRRLFTERGAIIESLSRLESSRTDTEATLRTAHNLQARRGLIETGAAGWLPLSLGPQPTDSAAGAMESLARAEAEKQALQARLSENKGRCEALSAAIQGGPASLEQQVLRHELQSRILEAECLQVKAVNTILTAQAEHSEAQATRAEAVIRALVTTVQAQGRELHGAGLLSTELQAQAADALSAACTGTQVAAATSTAAGQPACDRLQTTAALECMDTDPAPAARPASVAAASTTSKRSRTNVALASPPPPASAAAQPRRRVAAPKRASRIPTTPSKKSYAAAAQSPVPERRLRSSKLRSEPQRQPSPMGKPAQGPRTRSGTNRVQSQLPSAAKGRAATAPTRSRYQTASASAAVKRTEALKRRRRPEAKGKGVKRPSLTDPDADSDTRMAVDRPPPRASKRSRLRTG